MDSDDKIDSQKMEIEKRFVIKKTTVKHFNGLFVVFVLFVILQTMYSSSKFVVIENQIQDLQIKTPDSEIYSCDTYMIKSSEGYLFSKSIDDMWLMCQSLKYGVDTSCKLSISGYYNNETEKYENTYKWEIKFPVNGKSANETFTTNSSQCRSYRITVSADVFETKNKYKENNESRSSI